MNSDERLESLLKSTRATAPAGLRAAVLEAVAAELHGVKPCEAELCDAELRDVELSSRRSRGAADVRRESSWNWVALALVFAVAWLNWSWAALADSRPIAARLVEGDANRGRGGDSPPSDARIGRDSQAEIATREFEATLSDVAPEMAPGELRRLTFVLGGRISAR